MKQILTILLIAFSAISSAQIFKVDATRFIGGDANCPASARLGNAVNTTDGGIVFVGLTTCWNGEWEIPPSLPDTHSSPYGNLIVGKVDANLNVVWIHVYGGSGLEQARSIIEMPDGYAILSKTESDDNDVSGNHGYGDLWLIRLDADGNLMWQKCYGSAYDEQAISLAATPDNGFILLGVSNGMGGDVPTHYSGSQFDYDWFVVKTDAVGTIQWTKSIGGTGMESFYGKILAVEDGYYLVGSSESHDYDCIDNSWHSASAITSSDYYVFKLDYSGNIIWCKSFGGSSGDDAFNAVWDEGDESINIVGVTASNDYMVSNDAGGFAIWVAKVDKNGAFKWGKCLGNGFLSAHNICSTAYGYCVLGSIFPGTVGRYDNWLFAIDKNGGNITDRQFGGVEDESPSTVIPISSGVAIIGGTVSPGFTEGDNLGHLSGMKSDLFISKLVFWPLGVANSHFDREQLLVTPNPSFGNLIHIRVPKTQNGNLHIYNDLGNSVFTYANNDDGASIAVDVTKWPKGLYAVSYQLEDGRTYITKIVNN